MSHILFTPHREKIVRLSGGTYSLSPVDATDHISFKEEAEPPRSCAYTSMLSRPTTLLILPTLGADPNLLRLRDVRRGLPPLLGQSLVFCWSSYCALRAYLM